MLVPEEAMAAKFLVTTDEVQVGTIHFREAIHLETTRCKQLARWEYNTCFAARAGKRFDEKHRLTLEPVEPGPDTAQTEVLLGEAVKLRVFDHDRSQGSDKSHRSHGKAICLRRPKEVVVWEQHMLELIRPAMMELNAVKHPQKRRRTEMPRALSGKDC
jgi:hypothetical protein